jgi:hypothetical protein
MDALIQVEGGEDGPEDAITVETKELSIRTTAHWRGSLDKAGMS